MTFSIHDQLPRLQQEFKKLSSGKGLENLSGDFKGRYVIAMDRDNTIHIELKGETCCAKIWHRIIRFFSKRSYNLDPKQGILSKVQEISLKNASKEDIDAYNGFISIVDDIKNRKKNIIQRKNFLEEVWETAFQFLKPIDVCIHAVQTENVTLFDAMWKPTYTQEDFEQGILHFEENEQRKVRKKIKAQMEEKGLHFLKILEKGTLQQAMLAWNDICTREWLLEYLKSQNKINYGELKDKINQVVLSVKIAHAYNRGVSVSNEPRYQIEDIIQIAEKILRISPTDIDDIKVTIQDKKVATLIPDPLNNDVYLIHGIYGESYGGGFKIVQTATRIQRQKWKIDPYVRYKTVKEISSEKFKSYQKSLKKELFFLEKHGFSDKWFPKIKAIISYTTKNIGFMKQYTTDALNISEQLRPKECILIIQNLIFALGDFHDKKLIHGDIKPDNILIQRNNEGFIDQAVISDFGLSFKNNKEKTVRYYGTPSYTAPEVFFIGGIKGKKGDPDTFKRIEAFALGLTLYRILFNVQFWTVPYDREEKKIKVLEFYIERQAKESFKKLDQRIRNEQDAFIRELLITIKGLLTLDPAKRMSVQGARRKILMFKEKKIAIEIEKMLQDSVDIQKTNGLRDLLKSDSYENDKEVYRCLEQIEQWIMGEGGI